MFYITLWANCEVFFCHFKVFRTFLMYGTAIISLMMLTSARHGLPQISQRQSTDAKSFASSRATTATDRPDGAWQEVAA